MIEDWIVDEPIKDENDINQTLFLTERQEILFLKKSITFSRLFLIRKKPLFFIKILITT